MEGGALLRLLHQTCDAIAAVLHDLPDWGLAGTKPGQYRSDLAADEAALATLLPAGVGVLSEESGLSEADRKILVVVDPVDGSTNASRGIPWYASSLCALDDEGPVAAVVANLATGTRYEAARGQGATWDGQPLHPSTCTSLSNAVIGLSGYPERHLGWRQFRALGAAALDLCSVASGTLDGYLDAHENAHGPWDYLGGMFVCHEAGALAADLHGRDLVVRGHADRRTPVAAGTPELLEQLREACRGAMTKL
ncbi:MAG: inositol monophosphatase [Actinobacteria bacterium]|nr:inositol monophosphatase [Actinomycetota bacterium]